MALENFNRIINVDLLNENGEPELSIKCPDFGQKPNIEITGQFTSVDTMPLFNVVIKNFYINNDAGKYQKIRIKAGYKNNATDTLEGVIWYMYTESPGPDASTVIQCANGNMNTWMTAKVDMNLKEGYTLQTAVDIIAKELGYTVAYNNSSLRTKTSNVPFAEQGMAKTAIDKLKKAFDVVITIQANQIIIDDVPENANVETAGIKIPFMSAPLQIVGGEKKQSTVTITAPWNPKIKIGSIVEYSNRYFSTQNYRVSVDGNGGRAKVISLQFHFSTVGRINQMVITGLII